LPDEAIPPIEMGDGAAAVAPEFKHLGSAISQSFDSSVPVTVVARIRLAPIAFTNLKLQGAIYIYIYISEAGRGGFRSNPRKLLTYRSYSHFYVARMLSPGSGCKCGKS
jgi:hypothetical protein